MAADCHPSLPAASHRLPAPFDRMPHDAAAERAQSVPTFNVGGPAMLRYIAVVGVIAAALLMLDIAFHHHAEASPPVTGPVAQDFGRIVVVGHREAR